MVRYYTCARKTSAAIRHCSDDAIEHALHQLSASPRHPVIEVVAFRALSVLKILRSNRLLYNITIIFYKYIEHYLI